MWIAPCPGCRQRPLVNQGARRLASVLLVPLILWSILVWAEDTPGPGEADPADSSPLNTGVAESDRAQKSNLIFVSLGGWALPAALNYERILGNWRVGGGAFILPTDIGTMVNLNARISRSVWSEGRNAILASTGGGVSLWKTDCHECSHGWSDPDYGLAISMAFEHRDSLLFRLECAVLWTTIRGLSNVEPLGLPLVVAPGISVGFTF